MNPVPSAPWDLPDPPPLPPTSLVRWALFESPWALSVVLVALGLFLWMFFRSRAQTRRSWAALGLVVLAAAVVLMALLVDTPREQMRRTALELVRAVAAADAPGVSSRLTDDCRLYYFEAPDGLDLAPLLDRVRSDFAPGGKYRLKDYGVLESDACEELEARGRAQIKVRVVPEATGAPVISWWRLDFRRDAPGRWRVSGIQPLAIAGVPNASGR